MHASRRSARATVLVSALTLLAAYGGGSSGGDNQTVKTQSSVDSQLAGQVPASVKSDGTITVGVDSTYAPNEYLDADGKTVVGWDVDLFDAIAAKLGLKTKWVTAPFDTLIQNVGSGKFEIGVSSFTINAEREKEAK